MKKKVNKIFIFLLIFILVILGILLIISALQRKPVGEVIPDIVPLFPFGPRQIDTPITPVNPEPEDPTPIDPGVVEDIPRLRRVADFPVTGFVPLDRREDFTRETINEEGAVVVETLKILIPSIRYNEKETGYIYESEMRREITQEQLTLTDIPGTQEVVFDTSGNHVVMRFFNENTRTVESFVASIPQEEEDAESCTLFNQNLSKGSSGEDVVALQKFLGEALSESVTTDGAFGSGTEALVTTFQTTNELEATGIFDEATRAFANQECIALQQMLAQKEDEPKNLAGGFFAENILQFVSSPNTNEFLYTFKEGDSLFAVTSGVRGEQKKQVFDSPFSEWMPQWFNGNFIALTTLASAHSPGYVYHLNLVTDELERITGNLYGLTTLSSPDGSKILISEAVDESLRTSVIEKGSTDQRGISLPTLAEKCVWYDNNVEVLCAVPSFVSKGEYPDDWYQGEVEFIDVVWQINTDTLETEVLFSPGQEVGQQMDIIQPALNESETYLYFIDQKTGFLWSYLL